METISDMFGSMVFNDDVMRARLPKETYRALRRTIDDGRRLDPALASIVANAMKEWAVEKGATHFTHWFQPMTGITAEKHESFISPVSDSHVMMEFSGKELIRGESDASSFPSGGLRTTFEARGYTAWDPTSPAFIKDGTLCIPTAFCSYSGEALDKKTPLLRSMEALNRQALRVLKLFGRDEVTRVVPTVGPEQEYFLVDRELFNKRRDLILTGRTLLGARSPKGQDLDDHYSGALRPRVSAYMRDLDEELWKLGILAKTEHNEAAPGQHELAPLYTVAHIATDHNQLTMEVMKKVADRHGLACILHEKPFAGVSGSGKHNNWSLSDSTGANLLEPGNSPHENAQFLLFLCAVIQAVDEHQDILRATVASAGNDVRLGASEAPPAIMSLFLGSELTEILESMEKGTAYDEHTPTELRVGVHVLPRFSRDTTDRNRTSPLAFTGNKFEFRSPGASFSIGDPNTVLNTIVADTLRQYADELEQAEDLNTALNALIRRSFHEHKRIIFNGNSYDASWVEEANRRGLLNLPSTADALPTLARPENVELFERHKVFTGAEMRSRCDILLDNYAKIIRIEAQTMLEMVHKDIFPAAFRYQKDLTELMVHKKTLGIEACPEEGHVRELAEYTAELDRTARFLEEQLKAVPAEDAAAGARYARDVLFPAMQAVREPADALEKHVGAEYWPYPTYEELMFSV